VWRVLLCQKRLRLSREVDECKPLPLVGEVGEEMGAHRGGEVVGQRGVLAAVPLAAFAGNERYEGQANVRRDSPRGERTPALAIAKKQQGGSSVKLFKIMRGWRAGLEEGGEWNALDEGRDGLLHVVQQLAAVGVRARVRSRVARLEALNELGAVANRLSALITQDAARCCDMSTVRDRSGSLRVMTAVAGDMVGGGWMRRVERGVGATRCATTE